jgi:hypothetical protein
MALVKRVGFFQSITEQLRVLHYHDPSIRRPTRSTSDSPEFYPERGSAVRVSESTQFPLSSRWFHCSHEREPFLPTDAGITAKKASMDTSTPTDEAIKKAASSQLREQGSSDNPDPKGIVDNKTNNFEPGSRVTDASDLHL